MVVDSDAIPYIGRQCEGEACHSDVRLPARYVDKGRGGNIK